MCASAAIGTDPRGPAPSLTHVSENNGSTLVVKLTSIWKGESSARPCSKNSSSSLRRLSGVTTSIMQPACDGKGSSTSPALTG